MGEYHAEDTQCPKHLHLYSVGWETLRDAQGGIGDEDYCKVGLINIGDGEIGLNLSLSTFASCSTYDDGFRP